VAFSAESGAPGASTAGGSHRSGKREAHSLLFVPDLLRNPCFAAGARHYSDLMDIALGHTIGLLCVAIRVDILLGTVAQSMPRLGLVLMLVYLPMNRSTCSPAAIRRLRACRLGARR
jgi:hypothetical protein